MPSRRCPHCRAITGYSPNVNGHDLRFRSDNNRLIHFDQCHNTDCGCVVAVVIDAQSEEVEIFPPVTDEPDALLPTEVRRAFAQALRSLNEGIWDGCVLMCRRALEEAVASLNAKGRVLFDKIDDLASRQLITADLAAWAHETRLAGKLGAHGLENQENKWNEEIDAQEIVEFSNWFFKYAFVLPKQLDQRRTRLSETGLPAKAAEATE